MLDIPPNEALTPRQLAARKAAQTKREKHEKRCIAARQAAATRKENRTKQMVREGKHSTNEQFNQYVNDAINGVRKMNLY